jgi:hypothetical protein
LHSNDCAERYRRAIPDGNERNRIAHANSTRKRQHRVPRDDPGDGTAKLQSDRRTFRRPDRRRQWDRRKEHYAKEAARRGRFAPRSISLPRLGPAKEQHSDGRGDGSKERKQDQCPVRRVLQTRTRRSQQKRRSRADHESKKEVHSQPFQMSSRTKVGPSSDRRQY